MSHGHEPRSVGVGVGVGIGDCRRQMRMRKGNQIEHGSVHVSARGTDRNDLSFTHYSLWFNCLVLSIDGI